VIANFIGTKSWRKILEWLNRKVDIFIGTKTTWEMLICALRAQDKDFKIELNNKYCIECTIFRVKFLHLVAYLVL